MIFDFELGFATAINFVNLSEEDRENVRRWRNHSDIRKWMFTEHEINVEEHQAFINGLSLRKDRYYWLVKSSNKSIGVISINEINYDNKTAFLGIYANPESDEKSKGHTLIRTLCNIAFTKIGLHTLKLEVISTNKKAISFYERVGFKHEGELREYVLRNKKYENVTIMGILCDEALELI